MADSAGSGRRLGCQGSAWSHPLLARQCHTMRERSLRCSHRARHKVKQQPVGSTPWPTVRTDTASRHSQLHTLAAAAHRHAALVGPACSPPDTSQSQWQSIHAVHRHAVLRVAIVARVSSSAVGSAVPAADPQSDPLALSRQRVRRLEVLINLRKLYRNLLRAESLLSQPSPVYQPHQTSGDKQQGKDDSSEEEEQQVLESAVEIIAEMQLTAGELKVGLRSLLSGYGSFTMAFAEESKQPAEQQVIGRVQSSANALADRAEVEIRTLPFASYSAAQAALDTRNARYRGLATRSRELDEEDDDDASSEQDQRIVKRLEQAQKFVARRIQPAVQKVRVAPVQQWVTGAKSVPSRVGGLWSRLNGTAQYSGSRWLPADVPAPTGTREQRRGIVQRLEVELDTLEKRLQEASKARETRLRKAGIPGRARMAAELRDMDEQVSSLSRALAVRTLQLEMEYIYSSIEDEALDIAQNTREGQLALLNRQGSSDEVALLAAEFGLLDKQLAPLVSAVDEEQTILILEEDLIKLASEVPDMRNRLGIAEGIVFGGKGISWLRIRLQIRDSVNKVSEGVQFFSRGVRLMGSDIAACGALFWRAAGGQTLKPREVLTLRRTARDILTFIPFAIILIAPLTPVGHVLIFGFIQKYFPGFFPTQFTARRQELMVRYEDLKRQLTEASELAEREEDDQELARATAAVARLTAPGSSSSTSTATQTEQTGSSSSENGSSGDGPAAKALRSLQQQVAQAEAETLHGSLDDVTPTRPSPGSSQR